jgi:hypothetical protein
LTHIRAAAGHKPLTPEVQEKEQEKEQEKLQDKKSEK